VGATLFGDHPRRWGALPKNEQDLHLFERIAFMNRRKGT
jgi:hypothetical protein